MLAAQSMLLDEYLAHFASLFGDKRSRATFEASVSGVLAAGSLICARIAAQAPLLSSVRYGAQRVLRFATGKSTQRSEASASRLVEALAERGVSLLDDTPEGTQV
jgi:hypothetical protein